MTVMVALWAGDGPTAIGDIPVLRRPGCRARIRVIPHRRGGGRRGRIGASHATATATARHRRPSTHGPEAPAAGAPARPHRPVRRTAARPNAPCGARRTTGCWAGSAAAWPSGSAVRPTVAGRGRGVRGPGRRSASRLHGHLGAVPAADEPESIGSRVLGDRRELQIVLAFSTALLAVVVAARGLFGMPRLRAPRAVAPRRARSGASSCGAAPPRRRRSACARPSTPRRSSAPARRGLAAARRPRPLVGVVLILFGVAELSRIGQPLGRGLRGAGRHAAVRRRLPRPVRPVVGAHPAGAHHRASRAGPGPGARRHGRPRPRLRAADPVAHPEGRRRPPRGGPPGPDPGARAPPLALRPGDARPRAPTGRRPSPRRWPDSSARSRTPTAWASTSSWSATARWTTPSAPWSAPAARPRSTPPSGRARRGVRLRRGGARRRSVFVRDLGPGSTRRGPRRPSGHRPVDGRADGPPRRAGHRAQRPGDGHRGGARAAPHAAGP